ncbi:MAG TPA: PQQ-binding-like beta-propeller repeat protein [Opitutaceae bacterium]|jgi:outer membrane protein assembly factor BamB/subtilisin family serine protease
MIRRCFLLLGLATAALAAQAASSPTRWIRPPMSDAEVAQGYRNDIVIARPLASHTATIDAEESREGVTARAVFDRLGGIRFLPVAAGETPTLAIARLKATGRYAYVETDRILHALDTTPNDPDFGQQWGLDNTGSNSPVSGPGIAGADIHAASAWDIRNDASSIIVATVDTGALLTHEDLVPNLWTNPNPTQGDLHGINPISSYNDYGNPSDDVGHGTHVAGIIGAVGSNGLETTGVAWKVQIMPLKFLGPNNKGSTSDEVTCLAYALSHQAKVINASFGSPTPSYSEYDAIYQLQQAGIILVCAAGNNSYNNTLSQEFPADYPLDNIVAVAASDNRDDLASFTDSDSGMVELAAPGEDILSLYNTSSSATAILSGTSMAAPMVTGSVALLLAQFPNDTYRQIINRVLATVDTGPNYSLKLQTGGRLNLARALASISNSPFNDNFAARAHLSGTTVTVRSNNAGATRESGEPGPGNATLWWDWTAPCSGPVNLATTLSASFGGAGTSYATVISVYTGATLNSLIPVTTISGSATSFTAVAGTTYEISVGSQTSATGPTFFVLSYANTTSSTALTLSGNSASVSGSTLPLGSETAGALYYSWTAPQTGEYQLVVSSPSTDPGIQVSTGGGSLGSFNGSAISSTALSPVSTVTFPLAATQGTSYLITIYGQPDPSSTEVAGGQFTLAITPARWAAQATDSLRCSPAVGPDGTIYIGCDDNNLYAIRPDGSTAWKYAAQLSFDAVAPAVAPDGTIYAGAEDGVLYALNPNGSLKWQYTVPNAYAGGGANTIVSSPAVAADGTIYFKDSTSTFYALNSDGSLKWEDTVNGASYASPTIGPDGTIYIGSDDANNGGTLYAFNADGTTRWTFNAGSPIFTAASLDASGNAYIATLGGTVYAVNTSGQSIWSYAAANSISSSPAIAADGTLYFGCYDHKLYALTASGTLRWTCALGGEVRASSPALDASGNIYIGCYDNNLYAVSPSGTVIATYDTTGWVRSSPLIAGTTLYFGSTDHQLYAVDLAASAAATPWPMYQAGPSREGRLLSPALGITGQPNPSVALDGTQKLFLNVTATGQGPLTYQWYLNGTAIAGATHSDYFLTQASSANDGAYTVTVTGPQGSVTSFPSEVGPGDIPTFLTQPQNTTVNTGGSVTLSALVTGGGVSYQWSFAGTAIPGATGPQLVLTNVGANQGATFGSYGVAATNLDGSVTSNAASLTVTTHAQLLNLSARANVQSGQNDLAAGFVVSNGTKQVVLRGVGPALAGYKVSVPLGNPVLTLFNQDSIAIATNSGWNNNPALSAAFSQVFAFSFPAGSVDTALLESLPSATYTIQVDPTGSETGVALAEIYDDDQGTTQSRLVNISAHASVGTGADTLIAGFVIGGQTSETILLRGVGPTLASHGISNPLPNPLLTLFDSNSNTLATNSGWGNSTTISAVGNAVYAFGLEANSADTAMVVTLPSGNYTAQLSGQNGTTGVGLVEVYEVR